MTQELKLEKRLKIKVEPGIFEWMKWEAGKATLTFLTLEELKEADFNVDLDYRYGSCKSRPPRLLWSLLKKIYLPR